MLNNKSILITGGTGTFGKAFVDMIFKQYAPRRIVIYSRDEYKQFLMKHECEQKYTEEQNKKLRFFIGDVRDKERLMRAFKGIDYVIHSAARKQVPVC